jgi:aerobic carbon-monoxide dehydrogenase medium subunit
VKCAPFDYVRAGSVGEAVTALSEADGEGKILAGGQSLVPVMALRLARPAVLVDINQIPGIGSVQPAGDAAAGTVEVGALTRHAALAAQPHHPLLAEAARWIGHTAIRTRGTAGGSLAHADPAAELPVAAVATGATVHIAGPGGTRTAAAAELFVAALITSLGEDEMITGISFPRPTRWGFAELARRHGDFALVTAIVTEISGAVRITLGGVAGTPVRAAEAEQVLASGGRAADVAAAAAAEISPVGDLHGPAPFRRAVAAELVRRALGQAGIN